MCWLHVLCYMALHLLCNMMQLCCVTCLYYGCVGYMIYITRRYVCCVMWCNYIVLYVYITCTLVTCCMFYDMTSIVYVTWCNCVVLYVCGQCPLVECSMLHNVMFVDATMFFCMFTSDDPHQTLAWWLYHSKTKMKLKNIILDFSFYIMILMILQFSFWE